MQNITIAGANYQDVPSVELNKTGGGTALFVDVSETDAVASDVVSGKKFFTANGTLTTGTNTWNWMGREWELVNNNVYTYEDTLDNTLYNGWTPSTTAKTIVNSVNVSPTVSVNMDNYEYLLRWRFVCDVAYIATATLKAVPLKQGIEIYQSYIKRPSNVTNMEAKTSNGNACVTLLTAPFIKYRNTTGTLTMAYTGSYGIYCAATAGTFANSTAANTTMTIKTPAISARCNSTYFATARGREVDMENTTIKMQGLLYRTSVGGATRSIYDDLVNDYNDM